jgi:hypothetical protein
VVAKFNRNFFSRTRAPSLNDAGQYGGLYDLTDKELLDLILDVECGRLLVEPVPLLHHKRVVHAEGQACKLQGSFIELRLSRGYSYKQ